MNALNQENRGQSKGFFFFFFFNALKPRIPIHYLCYQNITCSIQAQASLILELKILGLVPNFDPFPDKFLSLSCSLPLFLLSFLVSLEVSLPLGYNSYKSLC